mgnify:CR=1 FL=1
MANVTGTRADYVGSQDQRDTSYNLSQHTYPINLFDEQYGGNYVIFYINTSTESKLVSSGTAGMRDAPANRKRSDLVGKGITGTGAAAVSGAAGVAAGVGLGGALNVGSAPGNALVGGALSAGASMAISGGASLTQPQKRLDTAIALHMPNQLGIRYGVQYEEDNMAGFQMLSKGSEVLTQALSGDVSSAGGTVQSIAANLAITAGLPGAAGTARGMGVAPNPKKEQVFKGVDFRSFQFQYQFFPRNKQEADNVLEIIHALKYHMHPEYKDGDGFLFIYPSEFDIVYYAGNSPNPHLHKHTSCVLRDMQVNYTPQGQFNAFKQGMPSQINVDMTFLELAILTKDDIAEGF